MTRKRKLSFRILAKDGLDVFNQMLGQQFDSPLTEIVGTWSFIGKKILQNIADKSGHNINSLLSLASTASLVSTLNEYPDDDGIEEQLATLSRNMGADDYLVTISAKALRNLMSDFAGILVGVTIHEMEAGVMDGETVTDVIVKDFSSDESLEYLKRAFDEAGLSYEDWSEDEI